MPRSGAPGKAVHQFSRPGFPDPDRKAEHAAGRLGHAGNGGALPGKNDFPPLSFNPPARLSELLKDNGEYMLDSALGRRAERISAGPGQGDASTWGNRPASTANWRISLSMAPAAAGRR